MLPGFSPDELWAALMASVKLQSHYARLLNMLDDGERMTFEDAEAWLARLRQVQAIGQNPTELESLGRTV
jgi:hypothetical protein